jgi:hypothetical protein
MVATASLSTTTAATVESASPTCSSARNDLNVKTFCYDQSSTRLSIAEATHEAILRTSLLTRRRSATRFVMSSLETLLYFRLQRGVEGQGCSWRDRAASTEQGARNILQPRQRRVALERLR